MASTDFLFCSVVTLGFCDAWILDWLAHYGLVDLDMYLHCSLDYGLGYHDNGGFDIAGLMDFRRYFD